MLALAVLVVHFLHHWIWLIATEHRVHTASGLADVWDAPHQAARPQPATWLWAAAR